MVWLPLRNGWKLTILNFCLMPRNWGQAFQCSTNFKNTCKKSLYYRKIYLYRFDIYATRYFGEIQLSAVLDLLFQIKRCVNSLQWKSSSDSVFLELHYLARMWSELKHMKKNSPPEQEHCSRNTDVKNQSQGMIGFSEARINWFVRLNLFWEKAKDENFKTSVSEKD